MDKFFRFLKDQKKLVIGIIVVLVVAGLAILAAKLLQGTVNGPDLPPETEAPVTLPGPGGIDTDFTGDPIYSDDTDFSEFSEFSEMSGYTRPLTEPVTASQTTIVSSVVSGNDGTTSIVYFTEPPTESTTAVTTQAPVALKKREGVYTFLIVGLDQSKWLTDVLILVTFDTTNNTINCLSVPRDTYSRNNNRVKGLKHINLAYSSGGISQLKREMMSLVGYQVDRYIIVDMNAFVKIVNYIGGVSFNVPQNMNYDSEGQNLHIHLNAGYQTLSGQQALHLMRFRGYASADIGRISVRHNFLTAMAGQVLSGSNASRAVELAGVVFDSVRTDMSKDDMIWFAKKMLSLNSSSIKFYTLPGQGAYDSGMWIPYPNASLKMINTYMNPYNTPLYYLDMVSRVENRGK